MSSFANLHPNHVSSIEGTKKKKQKTRKAKGYQLLRHPIGDRRMDENANRVSLHDMLLKRTISSPHCSCFPTDHFVFPFTSLLEMGIAFCVWR